MSQELKGNKMICSKCWRGDCVVTIWGGDIVGCYRCNYIWEVDWSL